MSDDSMIDDMIANDPEMLESFVNESRDCLTIAQKDLQYLRGQPADPDPEHIQRAFRSVHTMKSAAGFLGLDNVAQLAMCMEQLLDHMRAETMAPDVDKIDPLLNGLTLLSTMLQDIKGSAGIDIKPLQAILSEQMPSNNVE